jgi:23S rRNA (adenine2503-C2)-methyltransferase
MDREGPGGNGDGLELLGYPFPDLVELLEKRYQKGRYHAEGLFRHLYGHRSLEGLESHPHFLKNPWLAQKIAEDYPLVLPRITAEVTSPEVRKYTLAFRDGAEVESVLINMHHHATLCISSQVGCRRGCAFCETARMGLIRNLTAGEIVAQALVAGRESEKPLKNIVFMGMGEPLDNLDAITRAVSVISEKRGINIPTARTTISTCGVVPGIRKLIAWIGAGTVGEERHALRLAVSLNGSHDEGRSRIMPVNRIYDMAKLKEVLQEFPGHHREQRLFLEYVLIPGENDTARDAERLADYLTGLRASLNVIKYNPGRDSRHRAPTRDEVERFCHRVAALGQPYRIRDSRGDDLMAACGQLRPVRE